MTNCVGQHRIPLAEIAAADERTPSRTTHPGENAINKHSQIFMHQSGWRHMAMNTVDAICHAQPERRCGACERNQNAGFCSVWDHPAYIRVTLRQKLARQHSSCPQFPPVWVRAGAVAALVSLGGLPAEALPEGAKVVGGQIQFSNPDPSSLLIQQGGSRAAVDFSRFDIQAGERVRIQQPDARSLFLGRVTGGHGASQIHGALDANGGVLLLNPHGVVIGPNGRINTGSFVASTLDADPVEFMKGGVSEASPGERSPNQRSDRERWDDQLLESQGLWRWLVLM